MFLCLLKLAWYIKCIFTSMAVSLWICSKHSCIVSACVSTFPSPVSCWFEWVWFVSTACACALACMDMYCMWVHVRLPLRPDVCCNLILTELMRVECWWPCTVSLTPDAKHAAGLSQISAAFTLLAANIPGLFHVFHPRHQYGEDSTTAYVSC